MNDTSTPWEPRWVYTISDAVTGNQVIVVHADEIEALPGSTLIHFKDRDQHTVLLHNLLPGHSITVTDKDGYSLQER